MVVVLVFLMTLSSCQTDIPGAESVVAEPAAGAIAADLSDHLRQHLPPAVPLIVLRTDQTAFGLALATSLKRAGYRISEASDHKDQTAIELLYSVRAVDGQLLAEVSTGSIRLARAYSPTAEGAAPASALSIIEPR
jgi:hypothetical protein